MIDMVHRPRHRTARLLAVPAVVGLLLGLLPAGRASAEVVVTSFNILGRGALMHFYLSAPEAVLPFTLEGGSFESYGKIQSLPHAFGYAGAAPVPLATSAGIALPEGIPENVREGIRSVDLKDFPNYCQADFPESRESSGESYCGGPAQPEKALGLTGAASNGHVRATGDFDDMAKTSILSEARIAELAVPGLQSKSFGGSTSFRAFVNDEGIPVAEASARIESLSVLGALVRFDVIESLASVVNDGTEEGSAGKVTLTIARAMVAGIPVQVSADGVTVSEPVDGLSPQQATEAVNKALANAGGASIRILPGSGIQRDGQRLIAQSPSLVVEYNSKDPTPARIVEQYGLAEVNALAGGPRQEADIDFSGGESTPESPGPSETTSVADEASISATDPVSYEPTAPDETVTDVTGALTEPFADRAVREEESPSAGAVDLGTSYGDQALVTQNAGANPALTEPSPWVRAGYALLVGLVVLASALNVAVRIRPA